MVLDGARGARRRSDLYTGSLFLLCKTNQPTPVALCLCVRKFAVARSCRAVVSPGFGRAADGGGGPPVPCGGELSLPWAGSALRSPPRQRAPRGSLLPRPPRAAAEGLAESFPEQPPTCQALRGVRSGARTQACAPEPPSCTKGRVSWAQGREGGRSPSRADWCSLLQDVHFQFIRAISH